MDKFLAVPITGQTNPFYVSSSDVIAVTLDSVAPGTKTVITYNSGNTATFTHTDVGTTVLANFFRDSLQAQIAESLTTPWTDVAFTFVPPSTSADPAGGTTPLGAVAISAITIA